MPTRSLQIHYFVRLLLFWLIWFAVIRILFIGSQVLTGHAIEAGPALQSLVAGYRLDLSTISYLILPSFFLWLGFQWTKRKLFNRINFIYHISLFVSFSLLSVGNNKMYHEWQALLNYTVLDYLIHPQEVLAFVAFGELFLLLALWIVFFIVSVYLFKKLVTGFTKVFSSKKYLIAWMVSMPILLVIAARGGVQLIPINESAVHFSDQPFYNHAAVNPVWYFIHSFLETESRTNPFKFMETAQAKARTQYLFEEDDLTSDTILTSTKPNIVFILLESWTADIIESLDGEPGVSPQFDSLRKEGLLFTQIYSAGARTDHGLVSILSGYPPPPHISIITIPYKVEKLNSITNVLAADGYNTSFYYGGESGFVNMKNYLIQSGIKTIIDKESFEGEQLNSKWGAHDEFVFERQLNDLRNTLEPFCSVLLTLSSHEPFEVPMETPYQENNESDKFRKSVYYSDHCLGEYFRKAKKEPWYSNTLFVLVADHGHRLPKLRNLNLPQSKRIPLLLLGDVLTDSVRGKTIDRIGNQNDIAATILHQLQKEYSSFPRSRDLLKHSAKEFAYYTTDNVLGWVTPSQKFIYYYTNGKERVTGSATLTEDVTDSLLLDAKAYVQFHYEDFLVK
ncbi:MAG: sulfatase-like hydrolase/transferase [Saprospiraceae bacterium]